MRLQEGTLPVAEPLNGTLTLAADGSFTYLPDADFNGVDSFVYELTDETGQTGLGTVTRSIPGTFSRSQRTLA